MKIRTALVLAFLVLSVVPLGAIVVYSYFASRSALESAYHAEAAKLTAQMDRRLGTIRGQLQERLAEVSQLPDPSQRNVVMTMGDIAPLVESVEFQPALPKPAEASRVTPEVAPAPAAKPALAGAPTPPPAPDAPMVIQIPQFGPEQRAAISKLTQLSGLMGNPSLTEAERADLRQQMEETQKVFGESMRTHETAIQKRVEQAIAQHAAAKEHVHVGRLQANVRTDRVVRRVLDGGRDDDDRSEINFAVDRQGNVFTRNEDDRKTLDNLGIPQRLAAGKPVNDIQNWVVVSHRDDESGLQVGVARQFGQELEGLRNTAAKNFGYGIALIFIAMIGIVPIANHITGDVDLVTRGAERIALGDLTTRLPVHSNNEIGQLATAFNRMAQDLSLQQQRIVEQERAAIEYERKSADLEEARRFQLSMLPKEVPRLDAYDIAVFTHTATEVGGDYYDFRVDDSAVAVTIGDATGHGARAGTMVAVIKALFAGYSDGQSPAHFLRDATEKIRRMDLGRMAMALQLASFRGREVTVASAGMPPAYVYRRGSGSVEEISIGATPLGTLGDGYRDSRIELAPGDTMLFMSDGFPELMNAAGEQFGYPSAMQAFAVAAKADDADGVISALENAVRAWHGNQPPNDDVTFVVVRAREAARSSFA